MKNRVYILFFCVLLHVPLLAQKKKVQNQPYGDQKLYHFGISVGLNFQDLMLTNTGLLDPATGETWFATLPDYQPGFSVGLLGDLYLNPYMNLRFTPMLHFGDKQFEFMNQDNDSRYTTTIRSNYLTAPLDLKIRSVRVNNYRPYVLVGAYTAFDLGRKLDEAVYMQLMDYGLSIGIGCDFYLPIIKIVPEIRFSFGLADVIKHDRSDLTDNNLRKYSDAIARGSTRMISLTFNFE
ncbi:MAG: PorT family protein [Candidatus Symbiothrix sp.]|jgi:hypothetical protein|nr:PorT family protein [Candidatus Symbiothrix sp.]